MAPITRRKQAEMEANSSMVEGSSPASKAATPKADTPKRGQRLALRGKEGEEMNPSETPTKKNTVITFEDEETSASAIVQNTVAEPAAPADVEEEEEEEESDDDAPEAVSTSKAASEIKAAAKATQKAAQEQATVQKRKRQEHDTLLKKQAEERKKLVEEARSSPPAGAASDDESNPSDDDELAPARPSGASRRGGQVSVPTLLPAEFLTDSDSEADSDNAAAPARSKPKRRKVAAVERSLARLDRGPQDATIGSTAYQVARKADGRLPPKMKQHSKSSKELLLKRNRAPAKRRGGGFLAKR